MTAKHLLRWSSFLVVILGLTLLLPSGVSAQEESQDPWEITEDTTLTEDHDGRIRIATDDVTFDCAGHTLTFGNRPDPQSDGLHIDGASGVTVQNCNFRGFYLAVSISGDDNKVLMSTFSLGEYAVFVTGSSNIIENNNFMSSPELLTGVLDGGRSNRVIGNDFDGLLEVGLEAGIDAVVMGNTFTDIPGLAVLDDKWGLNLYDANTCVGSVSDPEWICETGDGAFDDDDSSVFQYAIQWLAWKGVTVGCTPDRYCPNRAVTRGEMAIFVARMLRLPISSHDADYFTDDNGALWELAANKLYEAGISVGCGGTRFCGDHPISRAEMAVFFVRALDLPMATQDHFTDDEGNQFEEHINRVADAGITLGCNPPDSDHYCPDGSVTRGQMAAFFKRAWGGD